MTSKTQVIIFGLKNEAQVPSNCGCSCGDSGCGPTQTMGEIYEKLVNDLKNKINNVEFQFIDVIENDLNEHEDALDLMKKEFPIPYTKINGEMKFYGGISSEAILEEINKL